MMWPGLILLVLTTLSSVWGDICSSSFCTCEEGDVSCTGSDTEKLSLSAGSLPPSIVSLHLTNLASLLMETNTFTGQQELKEFSIENVKKVVLEELAYSKEEVAGHVTHFKMEGVEDLQLGGSEAFANFPQSSHVEFRNVKIKTIPVEGLKLYSDTMVIADCDIGQLDRESIYSDSQTFQFSNNKVGLIKEKAFSGSNNKFNFSDNDVGMMESNAISVAFLSGDVSRNTIHNFAGTPLRDIGPEPICMPDTDAYSYDDGDSPVTIEYNIVGSPSLVFQGNYFHQFSLKVLDFPGAHNVPLGALSISDNKVPCDCETIKELAILADFDHISDVNGENLQVDFGDNIFKKEFYTSSLCVTEEGEVVRLKRFARAWLAVAGDEDDWSDSLTVSCSDSQTGTDWIP